MRKKAAVPLRTIPDVAEGGLMGEWTPDRGLDKNRLIVEDKSRTNATITSKSRRCSKIEMRQKRF